MYQYVSISNTMPAPPKILTGFSGFIWPVLQFSYNDIFLFQKLLISPFHFYPFMLDSVLLHNFLLLLIKVILMKIKHDYFKAVFRSFH